MNLIKTWLYNSRSFALPQSIMPSLLAIVLALGVPGFNIWLGLLATLGVCMVHLGGNLLDDYFDYKDELLEYRLGLRQEGEKAFTDKYPYLKDGSTTPRQLAIAIAVFFGIMSLIQNDDEPKSFARLAGNICVTLGLSIICEIIMMVIFAS